MKDRHLRQALQILSFVMPSIVKRRFSISCCTARLRERDEACHVGQFESSDASYANVVVRPDQELWGMRNPRARMTEAFDFHAFLNALPSHLAERAWLRTPGRRRHPYRQVLYWTHHALRSDENPALDVAIRLAEVLNLPLVVYQGLSQTYRFASDRHHTFILEAARDLQADYAELGIPYLFHLERPTQNYPRLLRLALSSAAVVTDDFPIEDTKHWTERLVESNSAAVVAVDTACLVPMRLVGRAYDRAFAFREATDKLYRKRMHRPWPVTTCSTGREIRLPFPSLPLADRSLSALVAECDIDHSIGPVADTRGGSRAGYARWEAFRKDGLRHYAKRRNQIELDGVSRMSAYLHYGMVSPFRLAREAAADGAEKYLDELLIWRELAYSFCYYRQDLESVASLPQWALDTLERHGSDPRTVLSWESLARAKSGARLWDAAQRSLLKHGELHNNVRMTWGKALLQWSRDHHQALERLIDLNHRYALDGRDPASYGGILWCLGQFDRPFLPEQPISGSVRPRPIAVHEQRTDMTAYEQRVDRMIAVPAPRIAMIGTGLGGLMCTRILQDHGLSVQCFEKSYRPGGRASTRRADDMHQFDHGAQYFTCRDHNVKRYLDAWVADNHVAQWHGKIVSIDEPKHFSALPVHARYVGVPSMDALTKHLAAELVIQFDTHVAGATRIEGAYQLLADDGRELGVFDIVLWNTPPLQTARQLPTACQWRERLSQVEMLPCWAVMLALDQPWEVPFDGAFVNQGLLSWLARDSSKPMRSQSVETWVLHSTVPWANENLETTKEQVIQSLSTEAERVVGQALPQICFAAAHRWLYSRPAESLPESALWDNAHWLGACGDWCGGPRVEGALKSGMALAGRVLGSLHEHSSATRPIGPKQLSLFDELPK